MTDTIMYRHIQQYRLRWHEAKAAVENNEQTSADPHAAHVNYHARTEQWVKRLLPLDEVENAYQEIWHARQLGPFDGLKDAYESGLKNDTWGYEDADLLDVEVLEKVGKATEEIAVDAMDLPEQPPVDPDPWEPKDTTERLKEPDIELPDIDLSDHE